MKFCNKCNAENKDSAKFCDQCGTKFEQLCSCPKEGCEYFNKYLLPADSKFCPSCGTCLKEQCVSILKIYITSDEPIELSFGDSYHDDYMATIQLEKGCNTFDSTFYPFLTEVPFKIADYDTEYISQIDLSHYDTRNFKRMNCMFADCKNVESLDVTNFSTKNVENMYSMFENCERIVTLNLSSFDTSKVKYMHRMFQGVTIQQ